MKNTKPSASIATFCSVLALFISLYSVPSAVLSQTNSQTNFGTGLIEDDGSLLKSVELYPEFSNDGRRAGELARSTSLRPFAPFPQNQAGVNSCIGWAMGYAAMSIQHAYQKGQTDVQLNTKEAFSAMFIYNQLKTGPCIADVRFQDGPRFLKTNGNCLHREFDNPQTDCQRLPDEGLKQASKKNCIKDFVALYTPDTDVRTKVNRTRRSIAEGIPVVAGFKVPESFTRLKKENPIWKPSKSLSDPLIGGHAVTVVGYNDSTALFELMNSWGRTWGDDGFFYISYADFAHQSFGGIILLMNESNFELGEQPATQAIKPKQTLVNSPTQPPASNTEKVNEKKPSSLSGQFIVQFLPTDEFGSLLVTNGEIQREEIAPKLADGFYQLTKTDWRLEDRFQVVAKNFPKGSYIYLFSIDGKNKAEIHWPRNQRLPEHLKTGETKGLGEGALVAHSGAEIAIPGNDRALTRENLLPDAIVMLNSAQRIDDFQQRVKQLRDQTTGSITERMREAFGDILLPNDKINAAEGEILVNTPSLEGAESAIALIVVIENR